MTASRGVEEVAMFGQRTATDVLRDEHRIILRGLDLLETAAGRLARGAALPAGWWDELIGWFVAFADRNHHAKEEHALFPALVNAGVPSRDGPIAVMLDEHEEGRALIRSMMAGGGTRRAELAQCYVQLLRDHIEKENAAVLPLADVVLDEQRRRALDAEIEAMSPPEQDASIASAEARIDRLAAALAEPARSR